jgi:hypothetical protein
MMESCTQIGVEHETVCSGDEGTEELLGSREGWWWAGSGTDMRLPLEPLTEPHQFVWI